jgi:AraC-like DNA-binding protein
MKAKFGNVEDFYDVELITVKEAAAILGLSPKTIHNRKADTQGLTRIYQGRSVRLIRQEVLEHRHRLIENGLKIKRLIGY